MRILYITNYIPYPPKSGDRIRVYNLLLRVAKVHQVILAAPLQMEDEREALPFLREFCEHIITGKLSRQHPMAHLPGLFRFALDGKPLELKFDYSKELENKIKQFIRNEKLDIVQIEHSRMAFYVEAINEGKHIGKVLDFHNIASIQYQRIYPLVDQRDQKFRAWLFSKMMRSWEPHYANRFDRCITVSEADRQLLLKQNSALRVDLVPNGVDTTRYRQLPPNLALDLLMIGTMEYPPCSDMAIYFCEEILPLIRQTMPNVQIWIVGANPPPEVKCLNNDSIHVTGEVKEVLPFYQRSAVCVVPLRAGGGTRLKILEAMALGRPVISTAIGCEGLDVKDGVDILIANDPADFARKTVAVLMDAGLYSHIADNARKLVEEQYSWDAIGENLLKIYDTLKPD